MCIIIYRPKDHTLDEDTLHACFEQNGDGWGLMHVENDRVVVAHGMELAGLLAAYALVPNDRPMAIHFRWRTHGDIGMDNNHPYVCLTQEKDGTDLWLVHNGVIHDIEEVDKTASDTRHWIALKVQPVLSVAPGLLQVPEFRDMLEDGIDGSRILFLDDKGTWTFLNRSHWSQRDGCLYSTRPPQKIKTIVGSPNITYTTADGLPAKYDDRMPLPYSAPTKRWDEYEYCWTEAEEDDRAASKAAPKVYWPKANMAMEDKVDVMDGNQDDGYYPTALTERQLYDMTLGEIQEVVYDSAEDVAAFLFETCSKYSS